MNDYIERAWTLATFNKAIADLNIQHPPRKVHSEFYAGPTDSSASRPDGRGGDP